MSSHINIEIKAKINNFNYIKEYLIKHASQNLGVDYQIDNYFHTKFGRLKLREGNIENSLILYDRKNIDGPKRSDINLLKLEPNSGIKNILEKSNGIKVIVKKARHILFIENVKFHLDIVDGLGNYVEIEAIDKDGTIGIEKLEEQCNFYMNEFKINNSSLINNSYSDLLMERGKQVQLELKASYENFIKKLFEFEEFKKVKPLYGQIDHACYRVESIEDYETWKSKLATVGKILIESKVGGRLIATYQLFEPLIYEDIKINIIELPQPKQDNLYNEGFEHVEFVITEDFNKFMNTHKEFMFDTKGMSKELNPELRIILDEQKSFKVHHMTLGDVIKIENSHANTSI